MLLSLLLSLTPLEPVPLDAFYGREAQAWLLSQVAHHDHALFESLHGDASPKPYTVSSLLVPAGERREENRTRLLPGERCLLRITSLSTRLSELLLEKVAPDLPLSLELKWLKFKVIGPLQAGDWAGQATFADLARQAGQARGGPSATLEFASPTAFRSEGIDLTLPTPDQVWRSLYWRWNTFAPPDLQIDRAWTEFARACIVVSDFRLRSRKVFFKQGEKGAATGCVGQATYYLLPEKHCGEYAPFRAGAEQVLHTLAAFAFYSGVGHHTTTGLGQARAL